MSRPEELAAALVALVPGPAQVYDGTVPDSPEFPYVYCTTTVPEVGERAVTRDGHNRVARLRTTLVGLTRESVQGVGSDLVAALEGARPTVPGWSLGRVESVPNSQPVQEDRDVVVPPTNRHPLYAVLDWVLTASPVGT